VKQVRKPRPEVRAVLAGSRLQEVKEDIARLEDARVVGEQREDDANKELLQILAGVAGCMQVVMEPTDQLGRLDVDRIFRQS